MPHEINGLQIREETTVDERGRRAAVLVVTFRVGEQGPFTERMMKSEYTPEGLRAKLEDFARGVARLPGVAGAGV